MINIITFILWAIFCVTEANEDASYTPFTNHKPTMWPRFIAAACILFLITVIHALSFLKIFEFTLILASMFWLLFDISYNLFKGEHFMYIGTTAWIDQKTHGKELPVFFFKIMLVAISFSLFYYEELLNSYAH